MEEEISLLKSFAKTENFLDLSSNNYLYHGIFIPYFDNSSLITSIIENGLLTLNNQYQNKIISFEDLKSFSYNNSKGILNIFKSIFNHEKYILSLKKNNIVYFSSNKNLFNRIFDISFVVLKNSNYIYLSTNKLSEEEASKLEGEDDYIEYICNRSVLPSEFVAIRINLDKLLDAQCVEKMGVTFDEIIPRIISMVNDIYDKLEETNLDIPIINSNDGKILNKELFRNFKEIGSIHNGKV